LSRSKEFISLERSEESTSQFSGQIGFSEANLIIVPAHRWRKWEILEKNPNKIAIQSNNSQDLEYTLSSYIEMA
jgi:hypothetical protein